MRARCLAQQARWGAHRHNCSTIFSKIRHSVLGTYLQNIRTYLTQQKFEKSKKVKAKAAVRKKLTMGLARLLPFLHFASVAFAASASAELQALLGTKGSAEHADAEHTLQSASPQSRKKETQKTFVPEASSLAEHAGDSEHIMKKKEIKEAMQSASPQSRKKKTQAFFVPKASSLAEHADVQSANPQRRNKKKQAASVPEASSLAGSLSNTALSAANGAPGWRWGGGRGSKQGKGGSDSHKGGHDKVPITSTPLKSLEKLSAMKNKKETPKADHGGEYCPTSQSHGATIVAKERPNNITSAKSRPFDEVAQKSKVRAKCGDPTSQIDSPGGVVGPVGASYQLECSIVFVKIYKCASSTSGGIARRIAAHRNLSGVGEMQWLTKNRVEPGVWANHDPFATLEPYLAMLSRPVFLWTMIRDPLSRCLSQFNFLEVMGKGTKPTAENKINALQNQCCDFIYHYLDPSKGKTVEEMVYDLYDFVGVVSLYDESIVLLAQILSLPLNDVLYLPAKVYGSHDSEATGEPQAVVDFGSSSQFRANNARDFALLALASKRITDAYDPKFASGVDVPASSSNARREKSDTSTELQLRLAAFLEMKARALAQCEQLSPAGTKTLSTNHSWCYWRDNGCGFPCLDKIFPEKADSSSRS